MKYQLLNVLVFVLFGIGFVVVTVSVISRLLRPKVSDPGEPAKEETYECGEPAIGSSWVQFDIRFYTIALVFLIFDVEVAFLYPWALIFKDARETGFGLFLFLEVFLFIAILLVGFIYCWSRGDLDWIKAVTKQSRASVRAPESGAGEAPRKEPARA